MLNVVVLMAGRSDAFKEAGFPFPKNLVEINGRPLVQEVLESLALLYEQAGRVIILVQREENERFHTSSVVRLLVPDARVVELKGATAGAACTALLARDYIDNDLPLV